ncbi:MAG TPA: TfoX/Sxy family protein [Bradyrhizobium sp.]|uniref:TfoX/Sxy family protein n=1 Tax=Bradyrhizobium sp. TaxID=376 RepID=UPI002B9BFE23|nr:TfoX/Sxy family protein [Bradyrhizobium sp.]HLZ06502.1 TfoX/Sxy family protein [Bradyrhizobium sp.]
MAYDEELAERIRRLMAGRRGITERTMMGGLTFMNAKGLFCSASGKGGLLVRVDPASRDRFLGEAHVEPADIGARRMTGFLRVRPEGYRTEQSLKKWVERGLAAVADRAVAAKPKTAKRKAAKRGK